MPVDALELGTLFPNSAQAEFGGFGLRLFVSNGFFCAKAPLQPWFCQRHCVSLCKGKKLQKATLFAIVCRFTAFAALVKQGKLRF